MKNKNHMVISIDAEKHLTKFKARSELKYVINYVEKELIQRNKGHIQVRS